jgi:hypothetical protein
MFGPEQKGSNGLKRVMSPVRDNSQGGKSCLPASNKEHKAIIQNYTGLHPVNIIAGGIIHEKKFNIQILFCVFFVVTNH